MEKKSPHPRAEGAGWSHSGSETETATNANPFPQPKIAIHIKKDGPLYRVQVVPPIQLDSAIARPETFAGPIAARQAAGWLSSATGFEIVDLLAVPQ